MRKTYVMQSVFNLSIAALLIAHGETLAQVGAKPFTLKIAPDSTPYHAGHNVFIHIEEKNISDHSITCDSWATASTDLGFQYLIKNSSGKLLTPRAGAGKGDVTYEFCDIAPGQEISGEYLISWLYNLSQPGNYTIEVDRHVNGEDASDIVRSNTITITIHK